MEVKTSKTMMFRKKDGGAGMKGYANAIGYMGYVEDRYMQFASEAEYLEYISEE